MSFDVSYICNTTIVGSNPDLGTISEIPFFVILSHFRAILNVLLILIAQNIAILKKKVNLINCIKLFEIFFISFKKKKFYWLQTKTAPRNWHLDSFQLQIKQIKSYQ